MISTSLIYSKRQGVAPVTAPTDRTWLVVTLPKEMHYGLSFLILLLLLMMMMMIVFVSA